MWLEDFKQYFDNKLNSDNKQNKLTNILTSHHTDTYNEFINKKIPEIVKSYNPIIINTVDHLNNPLKVEINLILDDFKVPKNLYPNYCRTNSLSYEGDYIIKDFQVKYIQNNNTIKKISLNNLSLTKIPICILSDYCNLSKIDLTKEYLKYNECKYELGGYYIINGNEKIIVSQERLTNNYLNIKKGIYPNKYIAEIKSAKETGYEAEKTTYIKYVEYKKPPIIIIDTNTNIETTEDIEDEETTKDKEDKADNIDIKDEQDYTEKLNNYKSMDISKYKIMISFAGLTQDIPLFIIFKALGIENDKDILSFILYNVNKYFKNIYTNILNNTINDSYPIYTQQTALKYILQFSMYTTIEELTSNISLNLLPLSTNNYNKAVYLGYMTRKLLEVIIGYKTTSDRDSILYKRVNTSGMLFTSLFREWYIAFTRNAQNEMYKLSTHINLQKEVLFTPLDFRKLIDKGGNYNLIQDGIQKGFRGSWGVKAFNKKFTIENLHQRVNQDKYNHSKDGLVQELDRTNYYRALYILREINTPIDANMKIVGPRKLNATQFGYICPIDTPDGGNIGLKKTMSMTCKITNLIPSIKNDIIKTLNKHPKFIQLSQIIMNKYYNNYYIFYAGQIIGFYNDNNTVRDFYNILKLLKRNNILFDYTTSIIINPNDKEIRISIDQGRCIRPLYVLENNIILRNKYDVNYDINLLIKTKPQNINLIPANLFSNSKFIEKLKKEQSVIEMIDGDENYYSLIAMDENILKNNTTELLYDYLELHPSLILGYITNYIPFLNHTIKQRNLLVAGQMKQAIGLPATNYYDRMDTVSYVLNTPQKCLINTSYLDNIHYNDIPSGSNLIIAIMTFSGYNIEDALLFNKTSIERGLFGSTYYRTYIQTINKDKNELFIKPDIQYRKKDLNYSKLDDNGIIKLNSYITEEDVIIGKLTELKNSNIQYKDNSTTIHHGDVGIVDKIVTGTNQFNEEFIKVRMLMFRKPILGDKIGARIYNKGVIGAIVEAKDLPFTKDGIVPDIIINPHSIPTRQPVGLLMEILYNTICTHYGINIDATCFNNIDPSIFISIIEQLPYNKYGNYILYDSATGKPYKSKIFMGFSYYLRFKQMVLDKIQARTIGPYTSLEKQPVKGRARGGGTRIGELERDAILSHGMSSFLYESFTKRSDDYIFYISNKTGLIIPYNKLKNYNPGNNDIKLLHVPYSTKLFIQELYQMSCVVRIYTK